MEQLFAELINTLDAYTNERNSEHTDYQSPTRLEIRKAKLQDALNDYIDARIEKSEQQKRFHL